MYKRQGATNGFEPTLANVISSYTILENPAEYDVNFLIQGPSGGDTLFECEINFPDFAIPEGDSEAGVNEITRFMCKATDDNGEGLLPTASANPVTDWYDQQTLGLDNSTVYWKNIAPRPGTSQYADARSGKNDEMHVVVVDDLSLIHI